MCGALQHLRCFFLYRHVILTFAKFTTCVVQSSRGERIKDPFPPRGKEHMFIFSHETHEVSKGPRGRGARRALARVSSAKRELGALPKTLADHIMVGCELTRGTL